jgi:hypothetical protein
MKLIVFDRARGLPVMAVASLALVLAAAGCGGRGPSPTAAAPTSVVPVVPPAATTPAATTPTGGPATPAPTSITPAPTTPAPTAPAGPARCHTTDLIARLRGLDPAAGSRYAALVLTNRSTGSCRVYGYGGLQLLDAARHPVPTQQLRGRDAPPRLVLLRPGTSAYSLLHWSVVPADGESETGPCEPTASYLLVTPPDETQPITILWGSEVCSHGLIIQGAYRPGAGPAY